MKLLPALLTTVVLVACASDKGQQTTNGVDDVGKACAIRAAWAHATASTCNNCLAIATSPRCDCSDKDYAGECNGQQDAFRKELTCDGVDACVNACVRTDCTCVEACYANKAACRRLASARDGCFTEVCDSTCR